jgi:hypothetical protein
LKVDGNASNDVLIRKNRSSDEVDFRAGRSWHCSFWKGFRFHPGYDQLINLKKWRGDESPTHKEEKVGLFRNIFKKLEYRRIIREKTPKAKLETRYGSTKLPSFGLRFNG